MSKIENEIEEYFEEKEIVELSLEKQNELKNLVKQNKKRRKISKLKRLSYITASICLVFLVTLPIINLINKPSNPTNPPTIYYGDNEATKTDLQVQDAQLIISQNYPQYNFIFDEFNFVSLVGFYHPENNSLLALQIQAQEISIPYTLIEINLIVSNQFIFSAKDTYTNNATYSETEDYKMYKKSTQNMLEEFLKGYIIFDNYELYLNFNLINEPLFNEFI